MKVTGFNHLSIGTKNLAESVKFYESVLGMETIPSYNFGFKTKYLRCGNLQLHIFELAHVPAKWDPVRRQGPAPTQESTALPGDIGSPSDPISPGSAVEDSVPFYQHF